MDWDIPVRQCLQAFPGGSSSIVCNEGDTREGPQFSESRLLGTISVPHGHDVGEYVGGGSLEDFMEANTGDQGVLEEFEENIQGVMDYTNMIFDYNSSKGLLDLYSVSVVITCKTKQECISGRWFTHDYADCQFRITKTLISEQSKPSRDVRLVDELNAALVRMVERLADAKAEFSDTPE